MNEDRAMRVCRDPYGHAPGTIKEARHVVCRRLEAYRDAYQNMRDFAEESGLDTTCYHVSS